MLDEPGGAASTVDSGGRQRRVMLYGDVDVFFGWFFMAVSMAEALSRTKSEVHLVIKRSVHNLRLLDQVRGILFFFFISQLFAAQEPKGA